jgi:starch synthase
MPLYRTIREAGFQMRAVGAPLNIRVGARVEVAQLYRTPALFGTPRMFFIDHASYFDRGGIYGEGGADYSDNARRFALFSLAALYALPHLAPHADVVHAHHWHTALAIAALRAMPTSAAHSRRPLSVFSVHGEMMRCATSKDFGWSRAADEYISLYRRAAMASSTRDQEASSARADA